MNVTRSLYRAASLSALLRACARGPYVLALFLIRRVIFRAIWRVLRAVLPL